MTNKEAIEVINKECESTFMLLHCSKDFVKALCRIITTVENIDKVREEIRNVKPIDLIYGDEREAYGIGKGLTYALDIIDKYLGDNEVE